jgi:predicted nucleic acid-binding protein
MNDRVFFDTNTLLYATHPTDPKGDIVRSLLLSKTGVISVQVLNEFVNVARRKLKQEWGEVEIALYKLMELCPEPRAISFDTHTLAVNISKRYRYSIYDGLILAAATEALCSVVYSEDMQDGQRIDTVTIRNPFKQKR